MNESEKFKIFCECLKATPTISIINYRGVEKSMINQCENLETGANFVKRWWYLFFRLLKSKVTAIFLILIGLIGMGVPMVKAQVQSLYFPYLPLRSGVYLYGESSRPNVLGNAYLIFEVKNANVVGAFYMPLSSFDCIYGTLTPTELQMTIIDSYEGTSYPHKIAFQRQQIQVYKGLYRQHVTLEGLYPVSLISRNDRRILAHCQKS